MVDAVRLDAGSEEGLAQALERLAPGQEGAITLKEAQYLFSGLDEGDDTALSEFDESGVRNLGEFAASSNCTPRRVDNLVVFAKTKNE